MSARTTHTRPAFDPDSARESVFPARNRSLFAMTPTRLRLHATSQALAALLWRRVHTYITPRYAAQTVLPRLILLRTRLYPSSPHRVRGELDGRPLLQLNLPPALDVPRTNLRPLGVQQDRAKVTITAKSLRVLPLTLQQLEFSDSRATVRDEQMGRTVNHRGKGCIVGNHTVGELS